MAAMGKALAFRLLKYVQEKRNRADQDKAHASEIAQILRECAGYEPLTEEK